MNENNNATFNDWQLSSIASLGSRHTTMDTQTRLHYRWTSCRNWSKCAAKASLLNWRTCAILVVWHNTMGRRDMGNTDSRWRIWSWQWGDREYTIQRRYLRPNSIIYLIQARGHIRMVAAPKILGISVNTHLSAIWEHGYEEFEEWDVVHSGKWVVHSVV